MRRASRRLPLLTRPQRPRRGLPPPCKPLREYAPSKDAPRSRRLVGVEDAAAWRATASAERGGAAAQPCLLKGDALTITPGIRPSELRAPIMPREARGWAPTARDLAPTLSLTLTHPVVSRPHLRRDPLNRTTVAAAIRRVPRLISECSSRRGSAHAAGCLDSFLAPPTTIGRHDSSGRSLRCRPTALLARPPPGASPPRAPTDEAHRGAGAALSPARSFTHQADMYEQAAAARLARPRPRARCALLSTRARRRRRRAAREWSALLRRRPGTCRPARIGVRGRALHGDVDRGAARPSARRPRRHREEVDNTTVTDPVLHQLDEHGSAGAQPLRGLGDVGQKDVETLGQRDLETLGELHSASSHAVEQRDRRCRRRQRWRQRQRPRRAKRRLGEAVSSHRPPCACAGSRCRAAARPLPRGTRRSPCLVPAHRRVYCARVLAWAAGCAARGAPRGLLQPCRQGGRAGLSAWPSMAARSPRAAQVAVL